MNPNSALGRSIQKMAGSKWFSRVGPKLVPPIDRGLSRVSGGRIMMSRMMLPCAIITSTGRKSGLPRVSPLATVPLNGDLYVVGSNFGQSTHPAWSWNLIATPKIQVDYNHEVYAAQAELLTPEEKARIWPELIAIWPLFDTYVERSGRDLRVFRIVRL